MVSAEAGDQAGAVALKEGTVTGWEVEQEGWQVASSRDPTSTAHVAC